MDCFTGLFLNERTDLVVSDVVPLVVGRIYRSRDIKARSFGTGTSLSYDMYVVTNAPGSRPATYLDLVRPNGGRTRYLLSKPALNTSAGVYTVAGAADGAYGGSVLRSDGAHYVITFKDGATLVFGAYDGTHYRTGGLISATDRNGNSTNFTRDSAGRLTTVTSPNGRHLFFKYGTSGGSLDNITEASDDSGRKVSYAYFPNGDLQAVTDPLQHTESYTYDANHNMLTVTDKRNTVMVSNVYDPGTQRVMQQTYAKGTPAEASASFAYSFDSNGNLTQTDFTDERGTVRRLKFNYSGQVTQRIEALGKPEQQTYTYERDLVSNQILSVTDTLGRVTGYAYDANGNTISRTVMKGTPLAATWIYTYDPSTNQLTSVLDPLQHKTTITLDAKGNPSAITDALQHATTLTYDEQGRPKTVSRNTGTRTLTSTYTYDGPDLIAVTDSLQRQTHFDVDAVGRTIGVRDPAGRLWTMTYDAQDRVTQRCNPRAECASLAYDENGNLTQFVLGSTERDFTYDARDRRKTEGRGAAVELTLDYEPGGVPRTLTQASGRVQAVTNFDALGHPLHINVSLGGTLKRTRDLAWDSANRLQSLADSIAGNLGYTYDDRFDAVKTETGPTGTLTYSYYANGLRQSALPSGGSLISYGFDAANRLQTLTQAAGTGAALPGSTLNIGFTYDNADRRQSLTLANGVTLNYGWDDGNQLSTMTWTLPGGGALGNLSYGYDSLGQRTSMDGSLARTNLPTPVSLSVGGDGRISAENDVALGYDGEGRLTRDASYTYTWDELGQLIEVRNKTDASLVASYQYDAIGRRMAKTFGGSTVKYLHDGANPIQIQDGSGNPTEHLLAGGVDEWLARTSGAQTQTYVSDALGSVLRLTDATGAKLVDYTYDPYGGASNDGPVNTNRFQYAGREIEVAGLYFNRARYLRPKWGRFISQDPIGLKGGDNLYSYLLGNPLGDTDPTGLSGGRGGGRTAKPSSGPSFWSPEWWQQGFAPYDTSNCGTAECVAGLLPAKSENRTQAKIDEGQCELVCTISTSIPIPAPFYGCKAAEIGWDIIAFGAPFKLCSWICKK